MKVKLLESYDLNRQTHLPGEVVKVPDFLGDLLVRKRIAVRLPAPPPTPAAAKPEPAPAPAKPKAKADK